ncbi:hypothetical protein GS810_25160 [Rhodococcus hoagii]|nr:hypothetical protein [Prescottella equi]NKU38703.1 hypothetical protein [Prescottella equi]
MTAAVVDVAVLDALIDVLVGEASLVVVDAAAVEAFADDDVVSSSLPAEHPAKTSTAPATHITVDQRRAAPPQKFSTQSMKLDGGSFPKTSQDQS